MQHALENFKHIEQQLVVREQVLQANQRKLSEQISKITKTDSSALKLLELTHYLQCHDNKVVSSTIQPTNPTPSQQLTIPKAELVAAVLLSEWTKIVLMWMEVKDHSYYLFTDSTAALGWIKNDPMKYKTFVANRKTINQQNTDKNKWYHVETKNNPADLASRGFHQNKINEEKSMWFQGPQCIKTWEFPMNEANLNNPNENQIKNYETAELKKTKIISLIAIIKDDLQIFKQFSSCTKMIICYLTRFSTKFKGKLTVEEINLAEIKIIKMVQNTNIQH